MTQPRRLTDDLGIPDPGAARHLMTATVDGRPIKVVEVSGIHDRATETAFFYEPATGRLLYFGDDPDGRVSGRWTTAEPVDAEPLETDAAYEGDVPAWLLGTVEVSEAPQPRREPDRRDESCHDQGTVTRIVDKLLAE